MLTAASQIAVGAFLQQVVGGQIQTLVFHCKHIESPQTNYSRFGREYLTVYLASYHFRHLFEGLTFDIVTDEMPLLFVFHAKPDQQ